MKIHIIGGSGTGKTYLAKALSKKYHIPHYDLDDLQWDNCAETYGIKRDEKEKEKMLQNILQQNDWIVEGVYYKWCQQSFDEADIIYLLHVPRILYRYRIVKRFIKRKFGIEQGKRETVKSVRDLLDWADRYQKEDMIIIRKLLEKYRNKTIEKEWRLCERKKNWQKY